MDALLEEALQAFDDGDYFFVEYALHILTKDPNASFMVRVFANMPRENRRLFRFLNVHPQSPFENWSKQSIKSHVNDMLSRPQSARMLFHLSYVVRDTYGAEKALDVLAQSHKLGSPDAALEIAQRKYHLMQNNADEDACLPLVRESLQSGCPRALEDFTFFDLWWPDDKFVLLTRKFCEESLEKNKICDFDYLHDGDVVECIRRGSVHAINDASMYAMDVITDPYWLDYCHAHANANNYEESDIDSTVNDFRKLYAEIEQAYLLLARTRLREIVHTNILSRIIFDSFVNVTIFECLLAIEHARKSLGLAPLNRRIGMLAYFPRI